MSLPPVIPGYRLFKAPNSDFTGERAHVFFHNGYAQVDPNATQVHMAHDDSDKEIPLVELLKDLGYEDVTPEPEAPLASLPAALQSLASSAGRKQ